MVRTFILPTILAVSLIVIPGRAEACSPQQMVQMVDQCSQGMSGQSGGSMNPAVLFQIVGCVQNLATGVTACANSLTQNTITNFVQNQLMQTIPNAGAVQNCIGNIGGSMNNCENLTGQAAANCVQAAMQTYQNCNASL